MTRKERARKTRKEGRNEEEMGERRKEDNGTFMIVDIVRCVVMVDMVRRVGLFFDNCGGGGGDGSSPRIVDGTLRKGTDGRNR
jgi:hypothetical protein